MNFADAKRFCKTINPVVAVPMHCGLFDEINMNDWDYEKKVVPVIYEEVKF
jgi:L-ascorbate metabolism protein UlaG (beta-lactamase superfamily)